MTSAFYSFNLTVVICIYFDILTLKNKYNLFGFIENKIYSWIKAATLLVKSTSDYDVTVHGRIGTT